LAGQKIIWLLYWPLKMTSQKCQLRLGQKARGLVTMDKFKTTCPKWLRGFFLPIQNYLFLPNFLVKKINNYSRVQTIVKKPSGKKYFHAMKSSKETHVVVYDVSINYYNLSKSVHHQVVRSLQVMKNNCFQIQSLNQVRIMVLHQKRTSSI
jgi:hypothetical protein